MKIKTAAIPTGSLIEAYLPCNYKDTFVCSFETDKKITADDIQVAFWTLRPKWVNSLFRLRNAIVKPFGLQADEPDVKVIESCVRNETKHGMFTVTDKSHNETVIKLSDKHLTAFMSVYLEGETNEKTLYCTTIVRLNNLFGYVYFYSICPFHYLVVKGMMRFVVNNLVKNG